MKKCLLLFIFLLVSFKISAQHIDDFGFAQGIRYQCPKCIDSANNLTEAARVQTGLTVSLLGAMDLKGIEGFSSLRTFNCTNSKLKTLPANLPQTLESINVQFNEITDLPNLPNTLKTFDCSNNLLTALPTFPSTLRIIDCSYNQITTLSALPNDLTTLFCNNNQLRIIPALPNKLEGLMCSYNNIKNIPTPLPQTLIRLTCQYNDITCLPLLPNSLIYLDLPRTVICLPNIVKDLVANYYDGFVSLPVSLPACNDIQSPPCDTFPRATWAQNGSNASNSNSKSGKIVLFPNPTEGVVKIKCTDCTVKKVSVFNTIGQLVLEQNTAILNFSNLGSGMYLVKVETLEGEKKVEKIMRM
jgi:Secretion system C-terminal sorting domain